MQRRTFLTRVGAGGGVTVVGSLAGCTDQGGEASPTDTPAGTATNTPMETPSGADVAVATVDPFGDILVDSAGLSLYLFTQDSEGESSCYGQCAENWPPLTVEGSPTAGEGVTATLDTTERDDGTMQVTAAGHPLYYYVGDSEPGDTNGHGAGGVWYLLTPAGAQASAETTATATPTPTETMSGGGGGGAY